MKHWGKELSSFITVVYYEERLRIQRLSSGTFIFADIELLSPKEAEWAAYIWEALFSSGKEIRLLNHPTRSMRRFELLRMLHHQGVNRHNIHKLTDSQANIRFPVFIRNENDHNGPLTTLIKSSTNLADVVSGLKKAGTYLDDKIIAEFNNLSDSEGVYRKYSAFIVGNRIIARHIFFSKNWMIKRPDLDDKSLMEEELGYVMNNPHEELLRKYFKLASIEYGRIDYGMLNGKPQVWEINTNPMIAGLISSMIPERAKTHEHFTAQISSAFKSINCKVGSPVQLEISRLWGERLRFFLRWIYIRALKLINILPVTEDSRNAILNTLDLVKVYIKKHRFYRMS
ncbi:hypothetical protein OAC89_01575 [Deltaproteobacteria bacterium]|nr:hypothetical protein [Deltaproteobacteria bacterium]